MADRIIEMRALLKKNLKELGSKQNWDHITNQVSFFSFTAGEPSAIACVKVCKEVVY